MSLLNRDYECLLELYREKNITRAARKLGMQQSGLSKVLMRVESQMGKRLFGRRKEGLIPTAFVEQLVREISEVQDQWNSRYRGLLEQESRVEGDFRVGCHPVIVEKYLSRSYVDLMRDFPGLRLELVLQPSQEVIQRVIDGELDFGVVANPRYHPDLVVTKMNREYAALWAHGEISKGSPVYYNPMMMQVHPILRQLKSYRLLPVTDYQLIVHFLREKDGQGAILPSSMTHGLGKIQQASKPYYWTDICLIYRADIAKTTASREIIERLSRSRTR